MEINPIITGIISPLIALIPSLLFYWSSREKKKSPLAIRIIRKKAQIQKAELENKTRLEKLHLELKALEQEANYQNRMSKWESGQINLAENFKQSKTDELTNQLSDLKAKGEQVIQKGVNEVKNTVADLKSKGLGVVKGLTDKFKGLKIPSLSEDKKEQK